MRSADETIVPGLHKEWVVVISEGKNAPIRSFAAFKAALEEGTQRLQEDFDEFRAADWKQHLAANGGCGKAFHRLAMLMAPASGEFCYCARYAKEDGVCPNCGSDVSKLRDGLAMNVEEYAAAVRALRVQVLDVRLTEFTLEFRVQLHEHEDAPRLTTWVRMRCSECSWEGFLRNLVSFQRSGVRKPYECESAMKAARAKLPLVLVWPCEAV